LIYTYIDVQCDQIDIVNKIPNSKHGSFRVNLKKADYGEGQLLVRSVNEILGYAAPPAHFAPMPPVKSFPRHQKGSSSGVLGVALTVLFLGFCVAVGLTIILGAIFFTRVNWQVSPQGFRSENRVEWKSSSSGASASASIDTSERTPNSAVGDRTRDSTKITAEKKSGDVTVDSASANTNSARDK
jgi:hypothetical protein